jgi:hypothetical protein
MIGALPTQRKDLTVALIRIRCTCDVGEGCPSLDVDTETGDALVTGYVEDGSEVTVRIPARDVPRVLHHLGPRDFTG